MSSLFIEILNMSFMAGIAACVVILIRIPLKKAPKVFSYALWAVVLFRLLCPFTFESVFSLMPASPNTVPQSIVNAQEPSIQSSIPPIDDAVNFYLAANIPNVKDTDGPTAVPGIMELCAFVWLIGLAFLLGYATFIYLKLKRRLIISTHVRDNIYETDRITTPFVLGFIKPKIYLPLEMDDLNYILKHEQTHIRRRDYLIKPIAFLALALHWFNPIIWLSYFLMCKDMEMSCDESVLKQSERDIRTGYSRSLLDLSVRQSGLFSPLAFGESNTKSRIKNVLGYKRPALWISIASIITVLGVTVGFMANQVDLSQPWLTVDKKDEWPWWYMRFDQITFGSEREWIKYRMNRGPDLEESFPDGSSKLYYYLPPSRHIPSGSDTEVESPETAVEVTFYLDDPGCIERKGLQGVYRIDVIGDCEMTGISYLSYEYDGPLARVLLEYGKPDSVDQNGDIYTLWYYSPEDAEQRMWFEVKDGELTRRMGIICISDADNNNETSTVAE